MGSQTAATRAVDSRRLTGPSVLWDRPGAVLDVACPAEDVDELVAAWGAAARQMMDAVGWRDEGMCTRRVVGGVSLALSAPVDALYAATEVAEWAFACALTALAGSGDAPPDPGAPADPAGFEVSAQRLRDCIAVEQNPPLIALQRAAAAAGVAFLSDDDEASVGLGIGCQRWPVRALPEPPAVNWTAVHDVPIGLVTGTNGKTTTVRLAAAIARQSGPGVGMTSTEWLSVDGVILERGDYAGPGGARTILRQPGVRLAILETARGGLLRRGLGPSRADAVAITTVAEDHLGDFGSATLGELAAIKWTLTRALRPSGRLVLSADDELLVALATAPATRAPAPIIWCSVDPDHAVLRSHLAAGGEAMTVLDEHVVHAHGAARRPIVRVDAVPLTVGGVARHNVANALTAAALCHALGVGWDSIGAGLVSVGPLDNPGRGNLYTVDGVTVLVDFAHNPQAVRAISELARGLPAARRALCFGQAGDRTDAQMHELAGLGWAIGLGRVMIAELADHLRGRAPGAVPALLREGLLAAGAAPEEVSVHDGEVAALRAALDWARPGDLVVQLSLASRPAVVQELEARGAQPYVATPPTAG